MDGYPKLLKQVDAWFGQVMAAHPSKMQCKRGCFDCCLGLFDISLADMALMQEGLKALDPALRREIEDRARELMKKVVEHRPDLAGAETLEDLDDDEIDELTDAIGSERCACLGAEGQCLVYDHRPMICRLNGAPIVDVSGRIVHGEGCFKNSVSTREVPRLDCDTIRKEERRHLMRLKKAGFHAIENPHATMLIPMAVLGAVERGG